MASTVVQICNMALMRIGVSSLISSLSEASNEARACNVFYEQMRDYALRDYPWNFATKRVVLADAGTPPDNWGFKYTYPSDCLRTKHIITKGLRTPRNDQRIPFEIGNEGGQRVIYTNQDEAELMYTARVEDPTLFDPMFTSALAYLLASEIAMPLSVQPKVADQARSAYNMVASSAAAASMNEGTEPPVPESELISIRGITDGEQPHSAVVYGW
jgi:hypothetical protein